MKKSKLSFIKIIKDSNFNVGKVEEVSRTIGQKVAYNFNGLYKKHGIDTSNVKIIIVGTFTPYKGRERGVFYSSDNNPMYKYLDNHFKNNNYLHSLKAKLAVNNKDKDIIKDILTYLVNDHQLMFLDVIKCRADGDEESASDEDIYYFCLDKDAFIPYINKNIVFIPNSRKAEYGLNYIFKSLNSYSEVIRYTPQYSRHIGGTNLKERWDKTLI